MPSTKEARRRLAMALALGLCLGCGLAFGVEYIDNSIKTPEDAELLLQLPALAVIPSFHHEDARRLRLAKKPPSHGDRGPRIVAALADGDGNNVPAHHPNDGSVPGHPRELIVAKNPDSIVTEAYRTL